MTENTAPTPADVQQWFLQRLGIRLGPEMAAYVLRHMQRQATSESDHTNPAPAPLAVIGGDARTGMPLRKQIDLSALLPTPA